MDEYCGIIKKEEAGEKKSLYNIPNLKRYSC